MGLGKSDPSAVQGGVAAGPGGRVPPSRPTRTPRTAVRHRGLHGLRRDELLGALCRSGPHPSERLLDPPDARTAEGRPCRSGPQPFCAPGGTRTPNLLIRSQNGRVLKQRLDQACYLGVHTLVPTFVWRLNMRGESPACWPLGVGDRGRGPQDDDRRRRHRRSSCVAMMVAQRSAWSTESCSGATPTWNWGE
jgi:hypothetical protein